MDFVGQVRYELSVHFLHGLIVGVDRRFGDSQSTKSKPPIREKLSIVWQSATLRMVALRSR